MKIAVRVLAALLAILMVSGVCAQLFQVLVYAATTTVSVSDYDENTVYMSRTYVTNGTTVNELRFEFDVPTSSLSGITYAVGDEFSTATAPSLSTPWGRSSSSTTSATMRVMGTSTGYVTFRITVKNLIYRSSTANTSFELTGDFKSSTDTITLQLAIDLPSSYFYRNSGSGTGGEDGDYVSNIVVENVLVRDASGNSIEKIDEDTPPFTMDIVYVDYGLWDVDTDSLDSSERTVHLIDPGGFVPGSQGLRGNLYAIAKSSDGAPRFRATFTGMTFRGGSSTISFRAQYIIEGWTVDSSATAVVYNVREEDDEKKDEADPPTPYIIVSRYSYGEEFIEAGATFTLDMGFQNTSSDIPLENIVMTISPVPTSSTDGDVPLGIASASNTYYYDRLGAGGAIAEAVLLNVKPDSKVGSAGISIAFSYEYVIDKERRNNETTVEIAIPISQIDRFAVDPITDYSSWMTVDDEGWVTVTFVNRGKSPTYNISGYIVGPDGEPGQTEHYGNLEAGANGNLDFSLRVPEPGEFQGTVVIQYEDENSDLKEIPVSFVTQVDESYYGGWEEPDWGEEPPEEEEKADPKKVVAGVLGGATIAGGVGMYTMKRVMAKGKEDFDEDF